MWRFEKPHELAASDFTFFFCVLVYNYPEYGIACCFFLQAVTHPLTGAEKTIPFLSLTYRL